MGLRGRRTDQVRTALRELIAAEMADEIRPDGRPVAGAAGQGTHADQVEQARRRYDTARSKAHQESSTEK